MGDDVYTDLACELCVDPENHVYGIGRLVWWFYAYPDYEYHDDMCETLYNKIEEEQMNVVRCNYEMIYPDFSRLDYVYDKNIEELKSYYLEHKKEFENSNGFFE